jgi:hypothetical protein
MPVGPVIRVRAALLAVRRIGDFARTHSITKLLLGSLAWRNVIRHECYPLSVAACLSNRAAACVPPLLRDRARFFVEAETKTNPIVGV